MEITEEILSTAIQTNPEVLNVIKGVVEKSGFLAIERASFDSLVASEADKAVGTKISEAYSRLDADIKTVTGSDRQPSEKTHLYLKRAVGELSTEKGGLETQIADLQAKIKDGNIEGVAKDKMDRMEQDLQALKSQLAEKDKKIFEKEIENDFALAFSGLKINESIPKLAVDAVKNQIKNELFQNARRDENTGAIYFLGKDGRTQLSADSVQVKTVSEIVRESMQDFLHVEQAPQGGTGVKPAGKGSDTGIVNKDGAKVIVPDTVKTKLQLTQFLTEQGFASSSKEFSQIFATYSQGLPLR